MKETSLSRFTPSLLSHESLEALLVSRHRLAKTIVDGIRESALTGNKHYYLLIGARGIGKTHMVSLIFHRIDKDAQLKDRLLIAWLREEEWGVASYFHLLRVILRSLVERYDGELKTRYDAMLAMTDPAKVETEAEQMLRSFVGDKTLLLLAENLDEIFAGLGEDGQRKLRAFIQNNPFFTIGAAAQSLFNGVTHQTDPFYGFFETHHLSELTYAEAVDLVANIAKNEKNEALVEALRSPQGRARMRAVHHLAGGNPRVYVIFSQFVTVDSINSLVQPLLQTLDDLTPYYQSRMTHLSPQQRQIVEHLCEARGARSVKDITQACFISSQPTTASQLQKLRDFGYVRSTSRGRESYYELREPLLRLTLDVKKSRGEPISIIVDFLRIWYSSDELSRRLAKTGEGADIDRHYLAAALKHIESRGVSDLASLSEAEYERCRTAGEKAQALAVSEELLAIRGNLADRMRHAIANVENDNFPGALADYTAVIDMPDAPAEQRALALFNRGVCKRELGDNAEAIADYTAVIDMPNAPAALRAWATVNRGVHKGDMGDNAGAIADYTAVIDMPNAPTEQQAMATLNRGGRKSAMGDNAGAIADYTTVIDMPGAPAELRARALVCRGAYKYFIGGDIAGALTDFTTAIGMPDVTSRVRILAHGLGGECKNALGDSLGAVADYTTVIDIPDAPAELRAIAYANRGEALARLGRMNDAICSFERARELQQDEPNFNLESNRAAALTACGRIEEGRAALMAAVGMLASSREEDRESDVAIVRNLLLRSKDPAEWRRMIPEFVAGFADHEMMAWLGQGLVASIRTLRDANVSPETARQWLAVWRELAGDYKEMELPLRLLDAAVRYLPEKDDRPLLALPIEERKIIEPLLGIMPEGDFNS